MLDLSRTVNKFYNRSLIILVTANNSCEVEWMTSQVWNGSQKTGDNFESFHWRSIFLSIAFRYLITHSVSTYYQKLFFNPSFLLINVNQMSNVCAHDLIGISNVQRQIRWTTWVLQVEVHKIFIIVLTVNSTFIHERTYEKLTFIHIKTYNKWANEAKSEIDWHAITQGNAHAEINILTCCALLRFTFRCAKWSGSMCEDLLPRSFILFIIFPFASESNAWTDVEVASHVIWIWTFRFRRKREENWYRWSSNVIFEVEHYCSLPPSTHPPTFHTAGF